MKFDKFILAKVKISTLVKLLYFTVAFFIISLLLVGMYDPGQGLHRAGFYLLWIVFFLLVFLTVALSGMIRFLNSRYKKNNSKQSIMNVSFDRMVEQQNLNETRAYSAVIAKKQAEVHALQSQINPHFLYNTLDAIRGQALIDNVPVIADMTEALAILFRYSISQKGNLVTLRDEIRNVDKYLMIQQFRFNNKFNIIKELEDENLYNCLVPKLILQPLVENAIYHGLETKKKSGEIRISIYATQNKLVIRICDNGLGIPANKLIAINDALSMNLNIEKKSGKNEGKHTGIALTNVNQRIKLLMGDEYGLSLYSTPNYGTDAEVLLPAIMDRADGSGDSVKRLL